MFKFSRFQVFTFLALCATGAPGARAAVSSMEDLSGCKLPNGLAILPLPGTKQAENGVVLKLSSGTFTSFPVGDDGQVLRPAQILAKLRAAKTADLLFLPDGQGSLWAVSGRISELGASYLADAATKKLDIPMEIPATSRTPAGMFPGVAEGRTYLVQTTDQHYALVRVLEKSPTGLVVQYIYQPTVNLVSFDLPRADLVDYHRPGTGNDTAAAIPAAPGAPAANDPTPAPADLAPIAPRPPVAPLSPPSKLVLGPDEHVEAGVIVLGKGATDTPRASAVELSLDAFSRQRDQMIKTRMAIVAAPAQSRADIEKKTQAIFELANYLHADEAADLFVSQVTFLNTGSTAREFSQDTTLPCFSALKHMGKPAAEAALRGLRQLNMDEAGDAIDTPKYRADLLGAVIRSVEGDDIGNVILHREMDRETDAKKRAVFEYLVNKN